MKVKISEDGRIECGRCGGEWTPMVRPGGRMPKGYTICPHCGWDQRDGRPNSDGESVGMTVEDARSGQ